MFDQMSDSDAFSPEQAIVCDRYSNVCACLGSKLTTCVIESQAEAYGYSRPESYVEESRCPQSRSQEDVTDHIDCQA